MSRAIGVVLGIVGCVAGWHLAKHGIGESGGNPAAAVGATPTLASSATATPASTATDDARADGACDRGDEGACVHAADRATVLPRSDPRHAAARAAVGRACSGGYARACIAAARLALLPLDRGESPATAQLREALAFDLRACDLGSHEGCTAALPLLEGTPLADAAPLLTGATVVTSKQLGTIVALGCDGGRPTAWVASPPGRWPRGVRVRRIAVGELPHRIVAPRGSTAVYAVSSSDSDGRS